MRGRSRPSSRRNRRGTVAELAAGERLVSEGRDRWHSMRLARRTQRASEGPDWLGPAVQGACAEYRA
jgi:hypothetical protein